MLAGQLVKGGSPRRGWPPCAAAMLLRASVLPLVRQVPPGGGGGVVLRAERWRRYRRRPWARAGLRRVSPPAACLGAATVCFTGKQRKKVFPEGKRRKDLREEEKKSEGG